MVEPTELVSDTVGTLFRELRDVTFMMTDA